MNKIILTDADQTIVIWNNAFEHWIRTEKKLSPEGPITRTEKIEHWLKIPEKQAYELMHEFNTTGSNFAELPAYPDATKYIKKLNDIGFKFVVITACPDDEITKEKRKINLKKHFGEAIIGIHHVGTGGSKKKILKEYDSTFFIEDSVKHSISAAEVGHFPILISREHNKNLEIPEYITVVDDWEDIYQIIITDYYSYGY